MTDDRKADLIDTLEFALARINELEAMVAKLGDAVEYAHANGFEWPSDPWPASLKEGE